MITTIVAFLFIAIYFATDRLFRPDRQAQQLTLEESDRKSTYILLLAYAISILALLISFLLNQLNIGRLAGAGTIGWPGIALMALGIALRAWATRVLGRFYTRTLVTATGHQIVQQGPYRLVRHPGYSGSLLVWIGAGLATANWIIIALVALTCITAYLFRIHSEEAMLTGQFGQAYADYARRTRRLIPYLF